MNRPPPGPWAALLRGVAPAYADPGCALVLGDSREVLAALPDASVHAAVTDPPYELGFMNQAWDRDGIAFDPGFWREVLRVLRPGGHLAAFGFPRTYHRLACAVEDAGFELRDCLMWLHASGFPKSLDLAKATGDPAWEGWGTALKPAYEPILLARRPLAGTAAETVRRHGTGGLHIDACRVPAGTADGRGRWPANVVLSHAPGCEPAGHATVRGDRRPGRQGRRPGGFGDVGAAPGDPKPNGPLYGDEAVEVWDCEPGCPVALLDAQSGERRAGGNLSGREPAESGFSGPVSRSGKARQPGRSYGDTGGAARFFYTTKASRAEREAGLEGFAAVRRSDGRTKEIEHPRLRTSPRRNHHPAVKPVALLRWLIRLTTPPGGIVLDPFLGSGSTRIAAQMEGVPFLGIERDPAYIEIAAARAAQLGLPLDGGPEEVLADA